MNYRSLFIFLFCIFCNFSLVISNSYACDPCEATITIGFNSTGQTTTVSSTKDISNVVLSFCNGSSDYKFDNQSGLVKTYSYQNKQISKVIAKSGCSTKTVTRQCLVEDCLGVPGGTAKVDVCGICNGGNRDKGCDGVCFSHKVNDSCGVCNGSGPGECGCDLSVEKDECLICGGNGSSCAGCDGIPNSGKVVDDCGVCGGNNASKGCDGVCFSNKVVDKCGVCGGDGTSCDKVTVCYVPFNSLTGNVVTVTRSQEETLKQTGYVGCPESCNVSPVCDDNKTLQMAYLVFFDKYKDLGAFFGECIVGICQLSTSNPKFAQPNMVSESRALELVNAGLAEYGNCNWVEVCYHRVTKTVATISLQYWLADGATEGECTEDPKPCKPGDPDCIDEPLKPSACAEVNGFWSQTNIASVINLQSSPLKVNVTYTDLDGVTRGSTTTTINPKLKQDFIINDLGLVLDTYGTVCVNTDSKVDGAWIGGVATYKNSNLMLLQSTFGSGLFDFALYYPFTNPKTGNQVVSINTFNLGGSLAANWIRLTDAVRDSRPLNGLLLFYNENGTLLKALDVNIPDAGRFDFAGHEGIVDQPFGPVVEEKVGLAKFIPYNQEQAFYMTISRYFYDCPNTPSPAGCNDLLSAFMLPDRPPTVDAVVGNVSVTDATFSVIELINPMSVDSEASVVTYNSTGQQTGNITVPVPKLGSRHIIVNEWVGNGSGFSVVKPVTTPLSVSSFTYKLNDSVYRLEYGYSSPFTKVSDNAVQISQFNTFLGQENTMELHNTTNIEQSVSIDVLDYAGTLLKTVEVLVGAKSTSRVKLDAPVDTYGTLLVNGSGIVFHNFVRNDNSYVIPYRSN